MDEPQPPSGAGTEAGADGEAQPQQPLTSQLKEVAGDIVREVAGNVAIAAVVIACFALPMAVGNDVAGGAGLLAGVTVGMALALTAGHQILKRARARFRRPQP